MFCRWLRWIITGSLLTVVLFDAFDATDVDWNSLNATTTSAAYNKDLSLCRRTALLCGTAWIVCVTADRDCVLDTYLCAFTLAILTTSCFVVLSETTASIWLLFVVFFTLQSFMLFLGWARSFSCHDRNSSNDNSKESRNDREHQQLCSEYDM